MVEWNWRPGSAQRQATLTIRFQTSRAFMTFITEPSVRETRFQSPSSSTAFMNPLVTRSELFEDWPETVL